MPSGYFSALGRGVGEVRHAVPVPLRPTVDHGSARIAEAQQLGRLVEGLAGRVVQGLADDPIFAVARHVHPGGVSARDSKTEGGDRLLDRLRIRLARIEEERRMEMGLDVVDADERHAKGHREALRRIQPNQQRAREAGSVGHRDGVDGDSGVCIGKSFCHL